MLKLCQPPQNTSSDTFLNPSTANRNKKLTKKKKSTLPHIFQLNQHKIIDTVIIFFGKLLLLHKWSFRFHLLACVQCHLFSVNVILLLYSLWWCVHVLLCYQENLLLSVSHRCHQVSHKKYETNNTKKNSVILTAPCKDFKHELFLLAILCHSELVLYNLVRNQDNLLTLLLSISCTFMCTKTRGTTVFNECSFMLSF